MYETYGEDTYLASKMGEAYIKGHQGDKNDLKNRENAAACLKSFIGSFMTSFSFIYLVNFGLKSFLILYDTGYGNSLNGRDKTPAYIPENMLREVFLPPFAKGVLAGAPTVMLNPAEVKTL